MLILALWSLSKTKLHLSHLWILTAKLFGTLFPHLEQSMVVFLADTPTNSFHLYSNFCENVPNLNSLWNGLVYDFSPCLIFPVFLQMNHHYSDHYSILKKGLNFFNLSAKMTIINYHRNWKVTLVEIMMSVKQEDTTELVR